MKIRHWILPALTGMWLALCHVAPRFPLSEPGILFGFAPPAFLAAFPCFATLIFVVLAIRRRRIQLNLICAVLTLVATVPLLGLIWPLSTASGNGKRVRVMTFNVQFQSRKMPALLEYVKQNDLDLVFLQENKGGKDSPAAYLLSGLSGWHMASDHEVAILSRWPISNVEAIPMWSRDTRSILTAEIDGPQIFQAMTVHWSVPQFSRGFAAMRNGAEFQARDYEQTQTELAKVKLPLILGADFNCPPRHVTTSELSQRFENCFSARGYGFGWTFPSNRPWVRIDHLYVNRGFNTQSAQPGPNLGSDHLPLLAEISFAE